MEKIPSPELTHTGTQVNYYFVCRRKLWLFSRNFEMERSSDLVLLDRLYKNSREEPRKHGRDTRSTHETAIHIGESHYAPKAYKLKYQ
jgi:CRISPR/Cas system-associated exonuclease Cas4 (RecB family)